MDIRYSKEKILISNYITVTFFFLRVKKKLRQPGYKLSKMLLINFTEEDAGFVK